MQVFDAGAKALWNAERWMVIYEAAVNCAGVVRLWLCKPDLFDDEAVSSRLVARPRLNMDP